MRPHRAMTRKVPMFMILLLITVLLGPTETTVADPIRLVPFNNHHVVEISSDQPYVAGFHILSDDLRTYKMIDGATVTVAFPSTNASSFPTGSWLGTGLFLQAQDHNYLFIDYGFYMIVVLDSSGSLFVDVGLQQTMEASLPVQQQDSRLVFAYTWQLFGIGPATQVTLLAQWTPEDWLNYSIKIEDAVLFLMSIKVSELKDCENIMPQFYTGNVLGPPFPYVRISNFFQFGITGSEIIANNQWSVLLEHAMYLKQDRWVLPEKAWSIQGDISYLDHDATWGGEPYTGVDVQRVAGSDQDGDTLVFSYESRTLKPGTVLWDHSQANSSKSSIQSLDSFQTLLAQLTIESILLMMFALLFALHTRNHRYVICRGEFQRNFTWSKERSGLTISSHRPASAAHDVSISAPS
jgi:hypothetical protein